MTGAAIPLPLGLVVPVFEEAERLGEFLGLLAEFVGGLPAGGELVVVDDGSTDASASIARALLAEHPGVETRVLERPHLGKGAAVAAGLAALDTPLRAFCDLDLSTPLPDLARIAVSGARPRVLAIASRDVTGSHLVRPESRWREALGRAYNRLLQATVTPGVLDTQCGAKAATAEVWEALLPWCREEGFAWDAEAVAVAMALGIDVQEVPVDWQHDDRSKVRVLRDGVAMVGATRRIWQAKQAAGRDAAATVRPAGEVFDDENAALLGGSDRTHWWFRSKAALVATALRRTAGPRDSRGWLVDAGAGAGGVTALLGWSPERTLVVEGSEVLVGLARSRHGLHAARAGVGALPLPDGSVSVLCLLDVLEHLEDPVAALREARRALAPGGRLVVNVPAHAWLWSQADVELGHIRRYNRAMVRRELAEAGFEARFVTHVFAWLVPPVWLTRLVVRRGSAELGLDQTSAVVDRAAMVLTWLERQLVARLSLPLGTSVLCVAVRPEAER